VCKFDDKPNGIVGNDTNLQRQTLSYCSQGLRAWSGPAGVDRRSPYHVGVRDGDYGLFRCFFLEVLVVFHRFPVASPDESAGDEKPVAEVTFRQPVGRRF